MYLVRKNVLLYLPWDLGWCFFIVISGVLVFMALKSDPQTAVVLTPEHDGAANKYHLLALTCISPSLLLTQATRSCCVKTGM